MVLGCAAKSVKLMVFAVNLVVFLVGVAVLVLAVLAYVKNPIRDDLSEFFQHGEEFQFFKYMMWIAMIVGALILLLGFLGCCGAIAESSCMLCLYITLLVMLVAIEIVGIVMIVVETGPLNDAIEKGFETAEKDAAKKTEGLCEMFQDFANQGFCCPNSTATIEACNLNCTLTTSKSTDSIKELQSCVSKIEDSLETWSKYHTIGFVVLFAVEVLAILFGVCLCCSIREHRVY